MIYKRKDSYHMDVTLQGVRYRESLHTSDWREAQALEKKRIAEIQAGKGTSKMGREFARMPFGEAADLFVEERKPHVAPKTYQMEVHRLRHLRRYFGDKPLLRFKASDIAAYQKARRSKGISGRTLNIEIGVLRRIMRRAKVWAMVAEDVRFDRENIETAARVLSSEDKRLLFEMAGTRAEWLVVHCAAVLAASTTCRGVELKGLRWKDVDLFGKTLSIRRSKTAAGHRLIPLNADALAALSKLRARSEAEGAVEPDHFVFPACKDYKLDGTRPQVTWRTAWRRLVKETAKRAGELAAEAAQEAGGDPEDARARAEQAFHGFRFHDLRHQCITELAEGGASDHVLMALAGHLSRRMMEHYSHVRMAAKREAIDKLSAGLISPAPETAQSLREAVN